jgi:hypothetical protein
MIPHGTKFCRVSYPAEYCSAGYETPRNIVSRGLVPRGTIFLGVSYLAEQYSAGYCTTQKYNIIFSKLFCGVLYPAKQDYAGYESPRYTIPRGTILRGTIFRRVSYPAEQLSNSIISANSKPNLPKNLGYESGPQV